MLGLREGSSENYEVTKDLLSSLIEQVIEQDLSTAQTMRFIIDGGQAQAQTLNKGIRVCFGHDTPVQRCAVHKEINLLSDLPKAHHSERAMLSLSLFMALFMAVLSMLLMLWGARSLLRNGYRRLTRQQHKALSSPIKKP